MTNADKPEFRKSGTGAMHHFESATRGHPEQSATINQAHCGTTNGRSRLIVSIIATSLFAGCLVGRFHLPVPYFREWGIGIRSSAPPASLQSPAPDIRR